MENNLRRQLIMLSQRLIYAFLVQLFFCTVILANEGNAQRKNIEKVKISMNLQEKSLDEFFKQVESKTDFKFTYTDNLVDLRQPITVVESNISIYDVLVAVSMQTQLNFVQVNENIHVKVKKANSENKAVEVVQKADIIVSGIVRDPTGEPIPGVTVIVKGTTIGTVTELDGSYTLTAPDGAVLVFSFVGFVVQEINVGNQSKIDVTLNEDETSLDEVVVVGYGEQQKVNLTGAISTVKFDDELNNRPITNASQALGGTASGVWVSQNSGKPGADGAQIRVRGWGTLNNSNPLIIIDGVEGTFEQLNPADIESISVLKDAASAAIFGSKAANGVVLVTTKMGKKNEKMQVNINSYAGIQSLGRRYDLINNSADHMDLTNQALVNDGASPLFSEGLISEFRNSDDPYKYPNTDWFNELFTTAKIQEHNVSIRGGSAQSSSFLSFNYLNQEGIVPNTSSQRYGMRANMESQVNDWFKIGARLGYIRRNSEEPYADVVYGSLGRVFEMLSGAAPYIAPYTKDGRFGSVQAISQDGNLLYDNRNPLIDAANGKTNSTENLFTLNTSAEIKLHNNLFSRTTFSSNVNWNLVDRFNENVYGYTDSGIETITKNFNREGLEINRNLNSSTQTNLFSTLNYSKKLNEIHDFSGIAGIQLESNKIQTLFARRINPPKEGLTQVDAGTSGIQGEGNMNRLRMFSYFGRLNYSFNQKYLFEANLRADASSRFKQGNRWGIFPGFSAGWRLSDEKFIQDLGIFSNLKLRASWGKLGNQNIANYWPYLTVIAQNNALSANFGEKFAPGAAVTQMIDENITWETTSTFDIGMEFGFFDDKVTVEADYFKKFTENIIVQLPIPLILGGLTAPFENIGEMSNDGFEVIFNYNNLKLDRSQLGFNLGLNLTYIKNQVTKFQGGESPDQLYLIREGYAFNTLYGFKSLGIYQSDAEALEHMHSNGFKPKAGNLKFEDLNNDGRITFEDKQSLGNTLPKYTFGMSPNLRYKGFDLNLLFQGMLGVSVYNQNNFTNISFENRVFSKRWLNSWTPQNSETDIPSVKFNNSWDNMESSFWVQEIDFIKLKNIQFGYSIPDHFTSKRGIQKAYIYFNAQNVFVLVNKDYEGYDPERNTFDRGNNTYPIPRIISFGINLNF